MIKLIRVASCLAWVASLVGCLATSPSQKYADRAKTPQGCIVPFWTQQWQAENGYVLHWTGKCEEGFMDGPGELRLLDKAGKPFLAYKGDFSMALGSFEGIQNMLETGWKHEGYFRWLSFSHGKVINPSGRVIWDGSMYDTPAIPRRLQRLHSGTLTRTSSVKVWGEFDGTCDLKQETGCSEKNLVSGYMLRDEQFVFGVTKDGRRWSNWADFNAAFSREKDAEMARAEAEARQAAAEQERRSAIAMAQHEREMAEKERRQDRELANAQRFLNRQIEIGREIDQQAARRQQAERERVAAARAAEAERARIQSEQRRPPERVAVVPPSAQGPLPRPTQGLTAPAPDYSDRQRIIATSEPLYNQCIQLVKSGLYGGFTNSCSFKVEVTFCAFRPKEKAWSSAFNCEKQSFGGTAVGAGRQSADHTHGAEQIHWIACKAPATPFKAEWDGSRIRAFCKI